MAKKVFYDADARQRLLGGAEALYKAVKVTMGPKGQNVVIGKSYGGPTVTHDGVTVAKSIELPEDDESTLGFSVGAELIKQAANKMNDVAGDGTTTVTVLTYHILNEANKLIAAGHNPMELRKGVEEAGAEVLSTLAGLSQSIDGDTKRVSQVASISAGSAEIGELIAEVMETVGKDGVVTVEEGQGLELESEVVEGFTMDKGFVSPFMVTDPARMEAIYEQPLVLITDKKISSIQDILPLLEKAAQAGKKDLVVVAEDIDGEALSTLVLNRLKGVFNTLAIKAPSFGDRRTDILEDLAVLTGATIISDDRGISFENAELDMLGSARKVIATKDDTTIIEGAGPADDLQQRISQIKAQSAAATSDFDRDHHDGRVAALNGKVAVIKVGGATETEIEEKKFRVDDAVAAVKAAMSEGVVPGGGVTPVNLSATISDEDSSSSVTAGRQLLKRALLQPFRQLMMNAGLNPDELLPQVLKSSKGGQGFDVQLNDGELIDLMKAGIVDPARVTKEAIQNAVSIAATAMTMGALVVDIPEPEAPAAAAGGGMPGMGMM